MLSTANIRAVSAASSRCCVASSDAIRFHRPGGWSVLLPSSHLFTIASCSAVRVSEIWRTSANPARNAVRPERRRRIGEELGEVEGEPGPNLTEAGKQRLRIRRHGIVVPELTRRRGRRRGAIGARGAIAGRVRENRLRHGRSDRVARMRPAVTRRRTVEETLIVLQGGGDHRHAGVVRIQAGEDVRGCARDGGVYGRTLRLPVARADRNCATLTNA